MTDIQFMNFLFGLLWEISTDGSDVSETEWDIIKEEFIKRGVDFDYY